MHAGSCPWCCWGGSSAAACLGAALLPCDHARCSDFLRSSSAAAARARVLLLLLPRHQSPVPRCCHTCGSRLQRSSATGAKLSPLACILPQVTALALLHLLDFGTGWDPLLLAKVGRGAQELAQVGAGGGVPLLAGWLHWHWGGAAEEQASGVLKASRRRCLVGCPCRPLAHSEPRGRPSPPPRARSLVCLACCFRALSWMPTS